MSDIFENDIESLDELATLEDPQTENAEIGESYNFTQPLFAVKLDYSGETVYADSSNNEFSAGDIVIIPTRYGADAGKISGVVKKPVGVKPDDIVSIIRRADAADLKKIASLKKKENDAFAICRKKILEHRLDMKLICAHYLLEDPKALFFFSADNRIDFRELVKDLVSIFKMRIELRQIGVRDESRIAGGLGVCGREYCCHGVTDKLKPVSIRMAKDQNLSLNSMKISGQCGRLLCCLAYEHECYSCERKKLPPEGARLYYDNCNFKVTEVHPLSGSIRIQGEDGRSLEIFAKQLEKQNGRWKISE